MRVVLAIITLFSFTKISFAQPFAFSDSELNKNQFIVLYNINFEFAKVQLKENQKQLDSLANFLKKNDTLKVEIGVHTGFRGDEKYNLSISEKRANLIRNYLMNSGVKKSNIVCKGFGENKPVFEFEDWERIADTHRCGYYERGNRRVTVVIL